MFGGVVRRLASLLLPADDNPYVLDASDRNPLPSDVMSDLRDTVDDGVGVIDEIPKKVSSVTELLESDIQQRICAVRLRR
jgi:hypothetical protein